MHAARLGRITIATVLVVAATVLQLIFSKLLSIFHRLTLVATTVVPPDVATTAASACVLSSLHACLASNPGTTVVLAIFAWYCMV